MKVFNTIAKIVAALAAVAGAVYVVATYGDQIVAWAKKLCSGKFCGGSCSCKSVPEEAFVAEEKAPEAVPAQAPEAPAESPDVPVADEKDFEG